MDKSTQGQQHAEPPASEPMKAGQKILRNPSSEQKKVRRLMQKKAGASILEDTGARQADVPTILQQIGRMTMADIGFRDLVNNGTGVMGWVGSGAQKRKLIIQLNSLDLYDIEIGRMAQDYSWDSMVVVRNVDAMVLGEACRSACYDAMNGVRRSAVTISQGAEPGEQECGKVVDERKYGKGWKDPVCHQIADHSGYCVGLDRSGEGCGFIGGTQPQASLMHMAWENLPDDQIVDPVSDQNNLMRHDDEEQELANAEADEAAIMASPGTSTINFTDRSKADGQAMIASLTVLDDTPLIARMARTASAHIEAGNDWFF